MAAIRTKIDPERDLPRPLARALRRIGDAAAACGSPAFLVGGAVRDLARGECPQDVDVTIVGDATRVARRLAVPARIQETFGTVRLDLDDGGHVDLATARRESYPAPAALPVVRPADLDADLRRRDFTVNALALPLGTAGLQPIVDPLGGLEDLRRGRIRALHAASFVDDPTRGFRAVRFALRLGFAIEPATEGWIRTALELGVFDRLSSSRLLREWQGLLDEAPDLVEALDALVHLGLERTPGVRVPSTPRLRARWARVDPVRQWCAQAGQPAPDRWEAALALVSLELTPAGTAAMLRRLSPGRSTRVLVTATPEALLRIDVGLRVTPLAPSRIHAVASAESAAVLPVALMATERSGVVDALRLFLGDLRHRRLDISGTDLLGAGVPAGPEVARGLRAALEARLDGLAPGREEQLAVALAAARSPGPP